MHNLKGLLPFIDFIIGIETIDHQVPHLIQQEDMLKFLVANENQDIILEIYSIFTQKSRKLSVNINKRWPQADGLLGILFRAENYSRACQNIFSITEVYENSPAFYCQLKKNEDYLLGVAQIKIYTFANFQQFVQIREKQGLPFFICVFNTKESTIRFCQILPSSKWGGRGLLGCEFDFGQNSKLNFTDDQSKIKYTQVDFFPPKIDNVPQIEEKKLVQEEQKLNQKIELKQEQEKEETTKIEFKPKRELAANMLNQMNQNAIMQENTTQQQYLEQTSQQNNQQEQNNQIQVTLEQKPKEQQKYKYYSEKAQVNFEITQDDLLDTNIDLQAYING